MRHLKKFILGFSVLFFTTSFGMEKHLYEEDFHLSKVRSIPEYTIDILNKKIIFINVAGSYIIDNDHIDVVKQGRIYTRNQVLDISDLETGTYLLEIEHARFIYTDLIEIE